MALMWDHRTTDQINAERRFKRACQALATKLKKEHEKKVRQLAKTNENSTRVKEDFGTVC